MNQLIITGANGFLGTKLRKTLDQKNIAYSVDWNEFDRGDTLFHLAAKTNVDWCEEHPEEARKNNVDFTKTIAETVSSHGKLVYLSTDFGNENVYGKSKRDAEAIVQHHCPNHWIIRTSTLYGYNSPQDKGTFVKWVIQQSKQDPATPIPVAMDWVTSPTLIDDLTNWMVDHHAMERGVQYVVGPEPIDKFRFAEKVKEAFDLSAPIVPVLLQEVKSFKAARKSYPLLCDKLPSNIARGLQNMRNQMRRDGLV